ncbi:MAG TPA: class I SAM-dependent methyltransferase [Sediminibacterium sp.]|uniref:class I SAM-dependent methyltransferase n=1 Tax=Sediminibacterium sp. TaxID=1917865 RepID=UPI0008AE59B1|nr:class I SAM-dependent methyltransferase [Sediminibacterium sp.]OHC84413.1 MAG: SAM-dependent methyltransferase [Sphingobacteriia bacterium RIFOXYC2_FULL_35_18]OHC88092.1 MAG: SAM-dependent methyltransferase [Sphingobacteriia bacterium RIFOXYD2_FULL_35_12]HLD53228.1 class I SAM-dependent methyltransferase [Sediminibacterium sp.]
MENLKSHWEKVFATKAENEVSWFQEYPKTSVEFFELFNLPLDANIIDIGGGDSHLVDVFLEKGYKNIYVLDISANALERAKHRLADNAKSVHWIVSDVVDFVPPVKFDFWHDRAAFHFLTSDEKIDKYVSIAENNIKQDGYLILGTFSEKGPEKCSGLEIKQYSETSMSYRFESGFERIKCITEQHQTPFNTTQNFLFCSFQKK